jgi:antirestriction protein ArdC
MTPSETFKDVYSRVTEHIIADLEKGLRTWMKPWNYEHCAGRINTPLRSNGTPYRGINILLLWSEAVLKHFVSPIWMTYRQAPELGGQVRKGERGSLVVYANKITKTTKTDAGDDIDRDIHFMKGYTVFNVEQVDGLPTPYYAQFVNALPISERIAHADEFLSTTGAAIKHGGNRAYYSQSNDAIQLPPFEAFQHKESYYATALHELTHWTKHDSRLQRDFGRRLGHHTRNSRRSCRLPCTLVDRPARRQTCHL